MNRLFDAHCHLQDRQLASIIPELLETSGSAIKGWLVNGTSPEDWESVSQLAARDARIIPAFGLHPWKVGAETVDVFEDLLRKYLIRHPKGQVGEIGVDRWKRGLDDALQVKALVLQLEIAAQYRRPVTLHCLQAWGLLEQAWQHARTKPETMLLHAFSGSFECAEIWSKRGAYFSFSTYFLHPRKASQRDLFRRLSKERILVETDAPAMSPPEEACVESIHAPKGEPINHPLNLKVAYAALADVLGLEFEALASMISANFDRFRSAE